MPVIEVVQLIEVPDVPDIDLPYDDGEPLESNWHRLQINVLGDALHQHWQERTDFFAGGNMFVYYSLEQARTRDYKGPDFFVVTGVDGSRSRHSWIVWHGKSAGPGHAEVHPVQAGGQRRSYGVLPQVGVGPSSIWELGLRVDARRPSSFPRANPPGRTLRWHQ
jgi:hypothetical protein